MSPLRLPEATPASSKERGTFEWSRTYTGCMFASKTSHLIRDVRAFRRAGWRVLVVKPALDKRYGASRVVTHDGISMRAIAVQALCGQDILLTCLYDFIAIDEISLFDPHDVAQFLGELHRRGVGFIAAGLDYWADGSVNLSSGAAVAVVPRNVVLTARCATQGCQHPATMTRKMKHQRRQVEVGGAALYRPACLGCWNQRRAEYEAH